MFNPFDGALLAAGATGTAVFYAVSTQPVLGALITGLCMVLAKLIELWWKSRRDKYVLKLEQQLREARAAAESSRPQVETEIRRSRPLELCTRNAGHPGPCNGYPRITCPGQRT